MRHLVVGAGASLAEGQALGLTLEQCPPLISNFAAKLWGEFNPHPILDRFLRSRGYDIPDRDGRSLFYELERSVDTRDTINVERFFEFAWRHKDKDWSPERGPGKSLPKDYAAGYVITSTGGTAASGNSQPPSGWQNLLLHGLGSPLQLIILTGFYQNGVGFRQLGVAQSVGRVLRPGDAILNLNYDTLFELALQQAGVPFSYAPNPARSGEVLICKPHGSLNLVFDELRQSFAFGQPEWLEVPAPPGTVSFSGLLPPRYEKSYAQIPTAKMILAPLANSRPQTVSFWGVGFTGSDIDLVELYRKWMVVCSRVEVINPDDAVARAAEELLRKNVHHYRDVPSWLAGIDV